MKVKDIIIGMVIGILILLCGYLYLHGNSISNQSDKYEKSALQDIHRADSLIKVTQELDLIIFSYEHKDQLYTDTISILKQDLSVLKTKQNEAIIIAINLPDSVSFRQITARYHNQN